MNKLLRNCLGGGILALLAIPSYADEVQTSFNLTDVADMQAYAPEVPDFDNWTADGSNKYYSITSLTRGKVTISLGGGNQVSNKPRLYGTATAYDLRIYNTDFLTVELPEGCVLQEIAFDCNKSTASNIAGLTLAENQPGNISVDNKVATWTTSTDAKASSITFDSSKTIRISSITVTYEDPSAGDIVTPEYYLVGNFNDWEPKEPYHMVDEGGSWTLSDLELAPGSQFQIYDTSNYQYFSAISGEEQLVYDQPKEIELSYGTGDVSGNSWTVPGGGIFNITLIGDGEDLLVVELVESLVPDNLYFIGDTYAYDNALAPAWNPQEPIPFSKNGNTFTLTGVELKGTSNQAYFNFINATGDWDTLKAGEPFRYGPTTGGTQVTAGTQTSFAILETTSENSWIIADGVYDITVDFSTFTFTMAASSVAPFVPKMEVPENLYIVGNLQSSGGEWLPASAPALTQTEDGIFTIEKVTLTDSYQGNGYFAFTNIQTSDWNVIGDGSHRYGPASDTAASLTEPNSFNLTTGTSWSLPAGTYNFTVDFNEETVTVTEYIAPDMYINAAFNDYNPTEADKLSQGEEEEGEQYLYRGLFEIPEDGFSFNFKFGDTYYVPATDGAITFDNGTYTGSFKEGDATDYWTCADWKATDLEIVVNMESNEVTFSYTPEVADIWYLRGAFNDYNPAESEDWALKPASEEEGNMVYTGNFEIDGNKLTFNLLSPEGNIFVPSTLVTTPMVFKNYIYSDTIEMAYEEAEEAAYWTYQDWEGGYLTITLDMESSTLTVNDDSKTTEVKSIDKVKADDVIYNLQGVRVNKAGKGLYIINGKKVLVK